jgi:hypothetical protein
MTPEDMEDRRMGTHLDGGRIVTFRDDDLSDASDMSHLESCAVCTAELEEARERAAMVAETLATLDSPVDVIAAKASVRLRLDRERASAVPARSRIPIGRAAAILLVTAGAAAALPWSPISPWRRETTAPAPTSTTVDQTVAPGEAPAPASVAVDVAEGIEIVVTGASAGATLEVVWRDDASAQVSAPRGSSFALAAGRVEVGASAGAIRIEAPRDARLEVIVNGATYLERSAAGLSVVEPAVEVADGGVRFLVRER